LQTQSRKALDETGKKILAVHVSQAFDIYNVYGKDPEAIKSTYDAFEEDLAEFSAEGIDKAFKEYRKTNKNMPTPADIRSLLVYKSPCAKSNRPEYKILTDADNRKPATPEEIETVRKTLSALDRHHTKEQKREVNEVVKARAEKMWSNVPEEQKQAIYKSLRKNVGQEESIDGRP
jgi:hypothetical protein